MASESQCPWDKLRDLNSSTALIGHQVAVAAQSNEAQQPTTSFLSLPAEIRLKIYTFALSISSYHILSMQALSTGEASPKSVRCFMPHRAGHGQHLYCFDTREPVSLSLLRTCRLVYHEASFMPYSGNTFKFYQDPQAYRMFMANRSLLQLQEIRSLEIISEGPRFGEKKRNDIWLNMCTTMELMTSLKHLKLALRMDPFEASGVNAWQWLTHPYDPRISPFSLSDDWVALLLRVRGLETFELTFYCGRSMEGKSKWIDPFIDILRKAMLGSEAESESVPG